MIDTHRIALTVILVSSLMVLLMALAVLQVVICVNDILFWTGGTLSILAFMLSAFIFGLCAYKLFNRVKRIWQ